VALEKAREVAVIRKLTGLRAQLAKLRDRRRSVRLGSAWATFLAATLLALLGVFVVDWSLSMTIAQRAVLLVVFAGVVIWFVRRWIGPSLGCDESILALAVEVERRHGLDSDLVAALEFEDESAKRWGSEDLREAVIADATALENRVDVFAGFSTDRLRRRLWLLLGTVLFLVTLSAIFPGHASTFLRRLALGVESYPTRTTIVKVVVGGSEIDGSGLDRESGEVPRHAFGRELEFEVLCDGELPPSAFVEIESIDGRLRRTVLLEADSGVAEGDDTRIFRGSLPRLTETVSYRVNAGDAWTDPARVEVIALPIVLLEHEVELPPYAVGADASRGLDEIDPGARQIAVLEGSTVRLRVKSTNKALESARLSVDEGEFALTPADDAKRLWTLDTNGTPFSPVAEPFSYTVRVLDAHGLTIEPPLRAEIRVLPDRRPRVRAVMISRKVLPTAKPTIEFAARDDFGLARIEVHVGIEQPGEEPGEPTSRVIREFAKPVDRVADKYALDLSAYPLRKGDEVTLVVEAFDERGLLPSESGRSEPLVLHVTDERGVISSMHESDERSARRLDEIIQKQLGIGGPR